MFWICGGPQVSTKNYIIISIFLDLVWFIKARESCKREGVKNCGVLEAIKKGNFYPLSGPMLRTINNPNCQLTLPDFFKEPLCSGHQTEADGEEGPQPHPGGQRGYNGVTNVFTG